MIKCFYLPRQYLPQPDGRVRNEGLGAEGLTLESQFHIESAATSRRRLAILSILPHGGSWRSMGSPCEDHAARQLTNQDYEEYDLLIGMDQANLRNMYRICGGDFSGKMSLLMEHTDHPGDVADPWYRRLRDHMAGCAGWVPGVAEGTLQRSEYSMLLNSNEYLHTVETIKQEIRAAQYKATVRVNQELLILYYSIGKIINEHKA